MDRACITIAAWHESVKEQKLAAAKSAFSAPGAETIKQQAQASTGASNGELPATVGASLLQEVDPLLQFTSKEATLAAASRQMAVTGFEPLADVFSRSEW